MRTFAAVLSRAAVLAVAIFVMPALGAEVRQDGAQSKAELELIPGAYLMTAAERDQYRQRVQSARTIEEKARIRTEHLQAMEQRARNVGLALNREPAAKRPAGDPVKGSALHNVCFSCHGSERYTAAKERTAGFLAGSVAIASGIEDFTAVELAARAPQSLPPGAPRMEKSRVRNLAGLKRAVTRWNDYFNPKLSDAEIDDLVAYLNAAYYKFGT